MAGATGDPLAAVDPGTRGALMREALSPFVSAVRIPEFDERWPAERIAEWLRVALVVDHESTRVLPETLEAAIQQRRQAELRMLAAVAEFHVKTAAMPETGGRPAVFNPDSPLHASPEGQVMPWDSRYIDRRAVEPTGATLRRLRETLGWSYARCGRIGGLGGSFYRGVEEGTEDRLGTRGVIYQAMMVEVKRRGLEFD